MAVGEFVDFSPGPQPGSFQFAKADGSSLLGTGPQAEQLAQMLERQKAAAPQPVAQAAPPPQRAPMATDVPRPNPAAPPPQREQLPAPPLEPPPENLPPPPQRESAPRGPQWEPVARSKTGTIVRDARTGQLAEMQAGSPGISRSQLQARQGQGVALPSAASESRQGGFDPSPEYLNEVADSVDRQKAALDRIAAAQEQGAEAESKVYWNQQNQQQQFIAQQQKAAAEAEELHKRDMAQLDQAQSAVRSSKVDPKRMFAGTGGTFRLIGSALAAGLGAFGATISRTPNFAMDIINRAIDRDIAAQEQEIATKKGEADNALKRWTASGADMKQAKAAVRIEQLEAVRQEFAQIASKAKLDTSKGQTALQSAQLDKATADEREAYRIKSLGQRTQEVTSRYAYPQGGTRGGIVPVALADAASYASTANTEANRRKAEAEAARGEKPEKPAQDAAAQVAVVDEIGKRLANKPSKGEVFSPEGQWLPAKVVRGGMNVAFGDRTVLPGSEAQRAEAAEFDQLKSDLISQNSVANKQGAQTDDEFKRNSANIGEARTWGELQAAQQLLREKVGASAKAYGVNVTDQPRAEDIGMQKRGPK